MLIAERYRSAATRYCQTLAREAAVSPSSLAKLLPGSKVLAADISTGALETASANAQSLDADIQCAAVGYAG